MEMEGNCLHTYVHLGGLQGGSDLFISMVTGYTGYTVLQLSH